MPTETYRVSVNSKGQVVIPAALRRKYGLVPKTRLVISDEDERIVLTPIRLLIHRLRGSLKGSGALKVLMEERAKDRKREEAKFQRFFGRKQRKR